MKSAAISLRIPAQVKSQLLRHAKAQRRSLNAQILEHLEGLLQQPLSPNLEPVQFLGLYAKTQIPSDTEIARARKMALQRPRRRTTLP